MPADTAQTAQAEEVADAELRPAGDPVERSRQRRRAPAAAIVSRPSAASRSCRARPQRDPERAVDGRQRVGGGDDREHPNGQRRRTSSGRAAASATSAGERACRARRPGRSRRRRPAARPTATGHVDRPGRRPAQPRRKGRGHARSYPRPWRRTRSRASWCAMRRPRARPRSRRARTAIGGAQREHVVEPPAASPMRLIAEIGSAWRASPRKPRPAARLEDEVNASRIADHRTARADEGGDADRQAAPSAPRRATIAAACGDVADARRRRAVGEREGAGDVDGERDREDRHDDDPGAADACQNSAMRERPVAARSRKTPESMSCAPAVAPTMAPTMRPSIEKTSRLS